LAIEIVTRIMLYGFALIT